MKTMISILLLLFSAACMDATEKQINENYRRNGRLIPGGRVIYQDEWRRLTEVTLSDSTRCVVYQSYDFGAWIINSGATRCGGGGN